MESPPHKLNVGRDEDRISALTDDLLVGILERLDLREAVRASALSSRWRHLPYRLSRLHLEVGHFQGATPLEVMDAFTGAAQRLLSLVVPLAEGEGGSAAIIPIKALILSFYMSPPHLSAIGRTVEDAVSYGKTECLEFSISPPRGSNASLLAEFGQQFMSFSQAYPVAFWWLTRLTLKNLVFGHSDVTELINACNKLKHLTLSSCRLVDQRSALRIDTPCSGLRRLDCIRFRCERIELISVPELRTVLCCSRHYENPPVRFGDVPQLCHVNLGYLAKVSQAPFMLSECLSRSSRNLSKLNLNFFSQTIWIQPEQPKRLTAIFRNLTDMYLFGIFPECDLSWTLFILEAAPALRNFKLSRTRHACGKKLYDTAEKTNVVWEPSKDLKHLNLKLLMMLGFEEEVKVTNYIRLVMAHVVRLKRIELHGEDPCKECNAIDPRRSQVDEASRRQIKERLTLESSSSAKIIIC
ncbi:hypothetical protein CFC21_081031 [Triticum aestivum]|uniref:F-box domain-containing protein n=2 Tax=Triticum aestivum TaxID=4565 RepID=A0A9R1I3D8_WHEAT|nr:uncharacterized protein LOC123123840 [Triticum aestivum]XP_044400410.1 uncharacterized protein LOC123123840 [Triticum aestivum]KAF7076369.1 hypothetical protein CFC21_081031 [Triticum aestivum]